MCVQTHTHTFITLLRCGFTMLLFWSAVHTLPRTRALTKHLMTQQTIVAHLRAKWRSHMCSIITSRTAQLSRATLPCAPPDVLECNSRKEPNGTGSPLSYAQYQWTRVVAIDEPSRPARRPATGLRFINRAPSAFARARIWCVRASWCALCCVYIQIRSHSGGEEEELIHSRRKKRRTHEKPVHIRPRRRRRRLHDVRPLR